MMEWLKIILSLRTRHVRLLKQNKDDLYHQTISKGNLYHQPINKGSLYHQPIKLDCS